MKRHLLLCALLIAPGLAKAAPQTADELRYWSHATLLHGWDFPQRSISETRTLAASARPAAISERDWWRLLWRTEGLLMADSGQWPQAEAVARRLQKLADPLADADAGMIDAALRYERKDPGEALVLARSLLTHAAHCRPATAASCDHPALWWLNYRMSWSGVSEGRLEYALIHARAAVHHARAAGEQEYVIRSLGNKLVILREMGDTAAADGLLAEINAIQPRSTNDAITRWYVLAQNARAIDGGGASGYREYSERIERLAASAGMPRSRALALVNLSDHAIYRKQWHDVVMYGRQVLALQEVINDPELIAIALHNRGVGLIHTGQLEMGSRDIEQAMGGLDTLKPNQDTLDSLQEYVDALADAGHPQQALAIYRLEEKVQAQMAEVRRKDASDAAQRRFNSAAEQHKLAQLERENRLRARQQALAERRIKIGIGASVFALLMLALTILALLRGRWIRTQLKRNHQRLRLISEIDPLTGIGNRRSIAEGVMQAQQHVPHGVLMLLDVDHFKRINDAHGHAAGDAVLAAVAARLSGAVRADDHLARWGGEEFLLLAPGMDAARGRALAADVLVAVNGRPVSLPDGGSLTVTLSIGWAAFTGADGGDGSDWASALRRVDHALYAAKQNGRNRAVEAGPDAAANAAMP